MHICTDPEPGHMGWPYDFIYQIARIKYNKLGRRLIWGWT